MSRVIHVEDSVCEASHCEYAGGVCGNPKCRHFGGLDDSRKPPSYRKTEIKDKPVTNAEKYKTAQERKKAFDDFCEMECIRCPIHGDSTHGCFENPMEGVFIWLELEAEEYKRSFCFYCKHQSVEIVEHGNGYMARCACCDYQSRTYDSKEEAYLTHNRVAKAVKESEVKV